MCAASQVHSSENQLNATIGEPHEARRKASRVAGGVRRGGGPRDPWPDPPPSPRPLRAPRPTTLQEAAAVRCTSRQQWCVEHGAREMDEDDEEEAEMEMDMWEGQFEFFGPLFPNRPPGSGSNGARKAHVAHTVSALN